MLPLGNNFLRLTPLKIIAVFTNMSKLRLYLAKNGSRCLSFVNFSNLYFELLEPVKNLRLNKKNQEKAHKLHIEESAQKPG